MKLEVVSIVIASIAAIVSVFAVFFSKKWWQESNRPLITARVTSNRDGGNQAIPLSLVIENSGNRPAKNIKLTVDADTLASKLAAEPGDIMRTHVESCFVDYVVIPLLKNGGWVTNSFGLLCEGSQATWYHHARFEIVASYEDIDGRSFRHSIPLLVADDTGFAYGYWNLPSDQN